MGICAHKPYSWVSQDKTFRYIQTQPTISHFFYPLAKGVKLFKNISPIKRFYLATIKIIGNSRL